MLNKNESKTVKIIEKTGFTFLGDSHFKSHRSAVLTMNSLERKGIVEKVNDEYGSHYILSK